ncbi:hypothetical protein ABID16_001872 [Rhizobium aquaticum]|uniref:Uncharacterized protein n=1 Tax=Rhizobium aquaticum TaxID=1549636 RepID=A0ABV2IYG1_9HYPH
MTAKTPSQILAETVVDKLFDAGLIREVARKGIESKLASGKIKGEDWKLELELAVAKESEK